MPLNTDPPCRIGPCGANRSRVFAAAIAWKALKVSLEEAIAIADPPPSGIVFESMMKWAKAQ
jgi:hypothetical protein